MMTTRLPVHAANKLDSIILLRGVAVLMVCLFHFEQALQDHHLAVNFSESFARYGKYGVHIFFVISGFVIPLGFLKSSYSISDYALFLFKRFLRLHPPYIAAFIFTLFITYISAKLNGTVFPENIFSILKGSVYLHIPRDNIVFWTLIVEIQFYFFIGLFFPLLIKHYKTAIGIAIPALLAISLADQPTFVSLFNYISFFLIGTIGFLLYTRKGMLLVNLVALILLVAFTAWRYETPAVIFSFTTLIIILKSRISIPKVLLFPGVISYSIYLVHFPLVRKIVEVSKTVYDPKYYGMLFVATMIVVIVFSWLFYKLIEQFAEKLSRKIIYQV